MPRALYIVRHGNTFDAGDIVRRIGRRTDLPLSTSGIKQAEKLGKFFEAHHPPMTKIYTAPLHRTMQTATAIAACQQPSSHPIPLPILTEIDYGPDENQPETAVVERIGQEALDAWNNHATPPADWGVDPESLIKGWRMLFTRIAREEKEGSALLAVTSNGVARFAIDAARAGDNSFPRKLRTGTFGKVVIDDAGTGVIDEWDIRPE